MQYSMSINSGSSFGYSLGSPGRLPDQLSHSLWGRNPPGSLPRWLQCAAKVENRRSVILRLSQVTHLLYLLGCKDFWGFFLLPQACNSTSSSATFCVILGLIFLIYIMEIRMTYFIKYCEDKIINTSKAPSIYLAHSRYHSRKISCCYHQGRYLR